MQNVLYELDLDSLEERVIAEMTPPMLPRGRANPTAHGKCIYTMLMEDQPEDTPRISFSYSRFREYFRLNPLNKMVREMRVR